MNSGGCAGRILRVDLTTARSSVQDTADYVPDYIGGRGIATRIAWDEIPPGVGAFDPENLLMVFTGPLTGTSAALSGRTTVLSLAPQGYPWECFTRASIGGHWGPALKYAGFDGLVVRGQSERPVYLWICDGQVEVRDASHLWGLGTYAAQRRIMADLGDDVRILTIGPAGEHRSRIAVINSETESAAGQGGFGAVMGAKRLKAIAVRGQGVVRVARPDEFSSWAQAIAAEYRPLGKGRLDPEEQRRYGMKWQACTQQCIRGLNCSRYYRNVPGVLQRGATHAGQFQCIAYELFPGQGRDGFYRWSLGFEAAFEVSKLSNEYGINQWDLLLGIAPWLMRCAEEGLIEDLDGRPIDFDDPFFWAELLRRIAFREGMGNALAEGGWRAARALGMGREIAEELYVAWGQAGHYDGHSDHNCRIVFPYWIVTALQWAMDTRNPISNGHGYCQGLLAWSPWGYRDQLLTWEQIKGIGERVWGTAESVDPLSRYEGKAYPAVWQGHRSVLTDSLTVCEQVFPRLCDPRQPDGFARLELPGLGTVDGPSFEYHLFTTATGTEWSEGDLNRACERILNLDRALQVRNWGRSRSDDETVIPNFERPENWVNPLLGAPQRLDRQRFRAAMDEYYRLRGWDVVTGRPTRARLEGLGLSEVADEVMPAGRR